MADRQYVVCKFREFDKRSYTYHNDGRPVAVGDTVRVNTRNEGWQKIQVTGIAPGKPVFDTKPIDEWRQGDPEPAPATD